MVENKSSIFGIIALIIGASGLGIGAYSIVNFQTVEGPQGLPGDDGQEGIDGTDGQDAPGGLIVGILDPDYGDTYSGNITIRALIYGSENYTVKIFCGVLEIGANLPLEWNSTTVADGWYNITIIATDELDNTAKDEVGIIINNNPQSTPQGGSVFIRWGNASAPQGTSLIYWGFGFASHWDHEGTPGAPIVVAATLDPGDWLDPQNNPLYPLVTYMGIEYMPDGIIEGRYIVAAVCYSETPSTVIWGTWNPPSGWKVLYRGYAMAGWYANPGSVEAICVESQFFDTSYSLAGGNTFAFIYGLELLYSPFSSLQDNRFIKCAVIAMEP